MRWLAIESIVAGSIATVGGAREGKGILIAIGINIRGLAGLSDIRCSGNRLTFGAGTRAQDGFHALDILGQALGLVFGATRVLRSHGGESAIDVQIGVAQECNGKCSVADRR